MFAIENPTSNMFRTLRHAWRNLSLLGFLGQHPTIGSDSRGDFGTTNPKPRDPKKHDDAWKIHHEDVFPIEDRDFPMSCSFLGMITIGLLMM